ncbi:uncharacterized protein N7498_003056 [Penicillium cinerascens]|uniref:Uncharacterized protein n=1 Tax=Penicillium cinerascens TaxID=70096 RepID=A0A9W9TBS8_9EURO|nr:uncharacterized protein N7498_003056 [Penicillium cinerascens]KAJ5216649.1 hypothetical protein N7498_003056 [Penicillium cinerascens]
MGASSVKSLQSTGHDARALDEEEARLLRAQIQLPSSSAGYGSIFRFRTKIDTLVLIMSAAAAAVAGAALPLMTVGASSRAAILVVMGSLTGQFANNLNDSSSLSAFSHSTRRLTLDLPGIGSFLATSVSSFGFTITGESIMKRLRRTYLSAVLRQNIAFFDSTGPGEVTARISNDMNLIQDGISQKVGLLITGVSGFFAAIIVALVRDWRLGLVMVCLPVVVLLIMGGLGSRMKAYQESSNNAYAHSGSFAEEVISSIRTVTAYGSQERFQAKYDESLREATALDFKAKVTMGILMALMFMVMLWGYALAFWQGNRFLQQGYSNISQIMTVLLASGMAGAMLGHAAPFIAAIAQAAAAANRIFATIERESPIDPLARSGRRCESVKGDIDFRHIKFIYPSRTNHVVFENFNLHIAAGKMTAIVGPSGSGKTSLFSLMERLYDPVQGQILLDGMPIGDLDVHSLRSQIGLVAQDNFLFNTSVYNNIMYGLGSQANELDDEKLMALVVKAAKTAQAHEFVSALPQGYHTRVGERGSTLSGGQRQRIAIARAVVSNPPILLLDEATAALDTKSENAVQAALYAAAKGRTTIVIAHRLSTIKKADTIVVIECGTIIEQGTHEELLSKQSTYANLVVTQQLRREEEMMETQESHDWAETDVMRMAMMDRQVSKRSGGGSRFEESRSSVWKLMKVVWSINTPERKFLVVGILCSLFAGPGYPVQAIFFGNAIISIVDPQLSTGHHTVNFWALMLLLLGLFMLVVYFVQGLCFAIAGSKLGSRARVLAFASILRQDMLFFDAKENSSGSLAAFLAVEASKLTGISGTTLGAILNSAMTLVAAVAVACPFGWKLGLVATSTVPILLACGFLRLWIVTQMERHVKRDTEAAATACEAVSAIRTVAALTMEEVIINQYEHKLDVEHQINQRYDLFSSLVFAATQSFSLFIAAFIFWYGGMRLIGSGEYNVQQFFICFIAIVWGAQAAGTIFSFAPDIAGAKEAAARLDTLLSRQPTIDAFTAEGDAVGDMTGDLVVEQVDFNFTSRPDCQILHQVSFSAPSGNFVALVGASGSGKTTVLNLIERFYDVVGGYITVDNKDIRQYRLSALRKRMAMVEQDSTLVGGNIRDCILGDTEDISDEEIMTACQDANIHDFVLSLPDGLRTDVGARGSRVSGGQKQRIALAKALLRNPKILLLDEATSALDAESERIVQGALDAAAKGRTTIAVAHRLSSIAHADCIYVFDKGRIVESGKHEELIKDRGKYWELVRLQDLGK